MGIPRKSATAIALLLATQGACGFIDTSFDNDADGFVYQDDLFYFTDNPDYAGGSYTSSGGESGGGLQVTLGGKDNKNIYFISGGWKKDFTLDKPSSVTVEFSYSVSYASTYYEDDEFSKVLFSVNDELIGLNGSDYISFVDDGDVPWTDVWLDLGELSAGRHTLAWGGYNYGKTTSREQTDIFFDNIRVIEYSLPSSAPTFQPFWEISDESGSFTKRHEACFVMVNDKAYFIGGRGKDNPVDVYDPSSRTWQEKSGPGVQLHHMQCVVVGDEVFIVSAWTGRFPDEDNVDQMFVYNTIEDKWYTDRTPLPADRQRGGAAAVLVGDEIFVSHGNRGGHGEHAVTLGWFDKYNIANDTWTIELPDAPHPRDHTGGALLADGRLCVAGGRDGGVGDFFDAVVLPTDCFNFETNTWEVEADIPQGRAGSAYGQTCDGKLIVAGGEGFGQVFENVEVFDGTSWETWDSLNEGRHGTGLAVSCSCNQIHIVGGAGAQGNRPKLGTAETLLQADSC